MSEQHTAAPARPEQERSDWQCKHTADVLRILTAINAAQRHIKSCTSAVLRGAQRRDSSSSHILSALERGWKETSREVTSVQGAFLIVHQGPMGAPATHPCLQATLAWIGCFSSILAIGAIFGGITRHFSVPLMLASFGPTAALLYGSPSLPTAQPWNALGKLPAYQSFSYNFSYHQRTIPLIMSLHSLHCKWQDICNVINRSLRSLLKQNS